MVAEWERNTLLPGLSPLSRALSQQSHMHATSILTGRGQRMMPRGTVSLMLCLDPIFQEKMEFQIFHLRGRVVLEGLQILVPRPGSQPVPPALEARSPNYWTARKVLCSYFCWKCPQPIFLPALPLPCFLFLITLGLQAELHLSPIFKKR